MVPYLFLAVFPIILVPIINTCYKNSINTNCNAKRTYLICCGLAMFAVFAVRHYSVGSTDSTTYYLQWQYLSTTSFHGLEGVFEKSLMERGYIICVWLLSHIFPAPQMLFVLTGVLFSISVCYYIYKNSSNALLSIEMYVCLGLYTFMMQGIRQSIAMSICLFAIEFCKKNKPLVFVTLVLLAACFHKTAIVFLVVYFFKFLKMNLKGYLTVVMGGIALVLFANPITRFANVVFEREYDVAVESGGFVATVIYVIIIVTAVVFSGKKKTSATFSLLFYITFFGLVTYIIRYTQLRIVERISYYFMFGQMSILPATIENFSQKTKTMINLVVIILCIVLFIYRFIGSNLIEYIFFWETV